MRKLLFPLLALLPFFAQAQINAQWIRGYNTDGFPADRVNKVATDGAGNTIITGNSIGHHTNSDIMTIKYDQNGDTVWTRRFDINKNDDYVNAIAIDASGNIYVTGYTVPLAPEQMVTIKYSPAGAQLWSVQYSQGTARTFGNSVAVDNSGNVYVTGKIDSSNAVNYKTWKYNSAGVMQWQRTYNGTGNFADVANSICIDVNGDAVVTGESYGPNTTNRYDIVTIKYTPAGNTSWIVRFNSPQSGGKQDYGRVVKTDNSGNIYVSGDSDHDVGGQTDFITIKYDGSGNQLWYSIYNPNNGWEGLKDMTLDNSGNVIVTGFSQGVGTFLDVATVKYNPAGNELWAMRHNGTANTNDYSWGVAADAFDNVYVAAGVYNNPGSDQNFMILKYDAAGNNDWNYTYHVNSLNENASTIAVTSTGMPVASGWAYQGFGADEDFVTISTDTSGNLLWMAMYNGTRSSVDIGLSLELDANENVFVAGYSVDPNAWYRYDDVMVFKMDSMGNTIWESKWDGPRGGYERASDLALDNSGNVIVVGWTDTIVAGTKDMLVLKYDALGNVLWSASFNGSANNDDEAKRVAVDAAGCIYVTGYANMSGANKNAVVLKYSPAGALLWTYSYNGATNYIDQAEDLVLDDSANVIACGYTQANSSPGSRNMLIMKIDSTGVLQWDTTYNGPTSMGDVAHAICMDPFGDFIITGLLGNSDVGTVKYDSDGNPIWMASYSFSTGTDEGLDVETDSFGNVNVVSKSFNFVDWDWATIQYSPAGGQNWVTRYDGPWTSDDEPYDLAMDTSGNMYVCGYRSDATSINQNLVVIKYDSAGVQQWLYMWSNLNNFDDYGYSVAAAPSGHVYVTGKTQEYNAQIVTYLYDAITIKLVPGLITSGGEPGGQGAVSIVAFPNPATDYITIHAGELTEPGMYIEVYNTAGQLMHQRPVLNSNEIIDCSHWAGGMYSVVVRDRLGRNCRSETIIVKH